MGVSADQLRRYEEVAVGAAKEAGELIAAQFYETKEVEHKSRVDLVTKTDKECEEAIRRRISQAFPDHRFIGEEDCSAAGATPELTDDPTWMVDPLDGTTNFVHGFPFVCVSIGLVIGKKPVVGVVFNPVLQELFTASAGQGAFLNGAPISVSKQSSLSSALLASEIGTKRDSATVDAATGLINSLLFKVRSLRLSGSCAMNLVGVACGRLDLFYEIGFGGPWDVAAGAAILVEAGGHVFDPSGEPFDMMSHRVAASNGHLKGLFVEALSINKP